ncbi:MAG: GNAT family N-acetyltransferase [Nitrosomonas ureae]
MRPPPIRYEVIEEQSFGSFKETVRTLYLAAFAKAPHFVNEEKSHSFISNYDEWTKKPGFQLLIAYSENTPVGFCFGWSSVKKDYWYEKFIAAEPALESVLMDCFELVDIGVSPSAQGMGVGKQLMKEITTSTPHKNLLLIVAPNNLEAKSLYLRMGWKIETERLHVTDSDYRIVMSFIKVNSQNPAELPRRC